MRHAKKKSGFWGAVWGNRSKGARIVIAIATALLSLILLVSIAVHAVTGVPIWTWIDTLIFIGETYDPTGDVTEKTPEELGVNTKINFPKGITNIALFGIDSRSDNMKGLSDSIMIISVDANSGKIRLVSVLRDSLVRVDGHGYQKINAAYSLGGPALAIKTLNEVFNLNILSYATVDFVGMSHIIDAVGGIDTVMTKAEVENANGQVREMHNSRGTPLDHIQGYGAVHLNGIQAVAYSRVRYADVHKDIAKGEWGWGDYGRTLRQRYVMSQLFQKALTLELSQYPDFIKALLPYIESSLDYNQIYDLAMILLKDGIAMEQARIPTDKAVISSGLNVKGLGQCVYYDLDYAADLVHGFLFENTSFEEYMDLNGIRRKDWFPPSLIVVDTDSDTGDSGDSESSDAGNDTDSGSGTDSIHWGTGGKGSGGKGSGGKGSGSGSGTSGDTTDTSTPTDSSVNTSDSETSDTDTSTDKTSDKVTDTDTDKDPGSGGTTDKEPDASTDKNSDKPSLSTTDGSDKPSQSTSSKEQ